MTGPTVCVFRISSYLNRLRITMVRKMSLFNLKLLKVDQCGDPDYVKHEYDLQTIISQL